MFVFAVLVLVAGLDCGLPKVKLRRWLYLLVLLAFLVVPVGGLSLLVGVVVPVLLLGLVETRAAVGHVLRHGPCHLRLKQVVNRSRRSSRRSTLR